MDLPRDEIAIRKIYENLVLNEKLKVVFRPGNRVCPNRRCYEKGEIVNLRIIEKPGNDELKIAPIFNEIQKKVKIKEIKNLLIEDIKLDYFLGSSPDVKNIQELKYHLGIIYNLKYDEIKEVTRIELEYLD